MYKRITRMLSGLLVLLMLVEMLPVEVLQEWLPEAKAAELLQEGYEAVPQQETKRSVETEVPPSYVSETEAGPEPVYEFSEATEEDYRYLDLMIGWDSFSQLSAEDAAFLIAYTGITEQEYIQAEANGKSLAETVNGYADEEQPQEEVLDSGVSLLSDDVVDWTEHTVSAPYLYESGAEENISLNTGALVLTTTDYVLPGKNGLDLVIGRVYDSAEAGMYKQGFYVTNIYYSVTYGCEAFLDINGTLVRYSAEDSENKDNGPYWTYADAEKQLINYQTETERVEDYRWGYDLVRQYYAKVNLETGGIDGTTTENNTIIGEDNYGTDSTFGLGLGWSFAFSYVDTDSAYPELHLSDGTTYVLTSGIRDYNLLDRRFEYYTEMVNYQRCTYRFVDRDGRTEYFDAMGRLIAIQDKYGNEISFTYHTEDENEYFTITDTYGQEIVVRITRGEDIQITTVTLPDGKVLTYEVDTIGGMSKALTLTGYVDLLGNRTSYSYVDQNGELVVDAYNGFVTNKYLNLTTITHPTMAQTHFAYELDRHETSNSRMEYYHVKERWDSYGNVEYNHVTFSREVPTYGAFLDYATTMTTPSGLTIRSEFDKHILIKQTVSDSSTTLRMKEYTYEYRNPLPLEEKTTIYNRNDQSVAMEYITSYDYDSYGNPISSWDTYAAGDTTNTEHKTVRTFDTTYNQLLTETFKMDADTTIKLQNTLDADKRHVISSEVYVNDVRTAKTDYTYDAYGNLISEKRYHDDFTTCDLSEYTYQNGGYLIQEKHGGIITANYTYDALGNLTGVQDGNGNTTSYAYDVLGNVTQVTNPDETIIKYTRDYVNNTVTVTDENGAQIKYTYTPLGLAFETVDVQTGSVITRKEYDDASRLVKTSDFVYGAVTEYTYDTQDRMTSETVRQGETILAQTAYAYDDAADGGAYQKITKTVVGDTSAPSVVTTQYTDKHGNLVKTGKLLDGAEYFDTYTYDYVGNPVTYLSANDAAKGLPFTAKYEYNKNKQVVKTYNAENQSTTNTYNALGLLARSTDYAGTPTSYTYDALGRLLTQTITIDDTATATTKYDYDANGNIIREWKPTNAVGSTETWSKTEYTYDTRSRLTKVDQYNGDAIASTTSYTYDGVGNLLTMTAGGSTTTYTYDRFGNVLTMTDALNQTETYTYSALGKPASKTDRNGNTIAYSYDALGRLLSTTAGDYTVRQTYTLTGQIATEQSNWQQTSYTYDTLGRVVAVSEQEIDWDEFELIAPPNIDPGFSINSEVPANGLTPASATAAESTSDNGLLSYVKAYIYDLADNRTGFTLTQNGATVQNVAYAYDNLNRLSTVSEDDVVQATYTYDLNGNRASLTYANGITETYSYNKANWITNLTNSGADIISSFAYTYYASGSQKSETDHTGKVTAYTYDDLNRLTQEAETNGLTVSYAYDAAGNRSQMTVTGTEAYTIAYTYDANNRLLTETRTENGETAATTYTYDANGNMLEKADPDGSTSYRYNALNQQTGSLIGHYAYRYAYNAQGIRTRKENVYIKTDFILDGGNVLSERKNGALTANYLRGVNLISKEADSATEYYLFNSHGDVVNLVNSAGAVTQSYDYDAFGNEKAPNAEDANPFRYCGEYWDAEAGIYYLRARYYAPDIGRFTQPDAHWNTANMIYGDNPQTINQREDALGLKTYTHVPQITAILQSGNLYIYCSGNPLAYRDSDGEAWEYAFSWTSFTWWLPGADGPLPVGDVVFGIGIGLAVIGDGLTLSSESRNEVSWDQIKEYIIGKASAREDSGKSTAVHHIVAKGSYKATEAQNILDEIGINYRTSEKNLIALKAKVHYYVHTDLYYALVNQWVCKAYQSGATKEEKKDNVLSVLTQLKKLLGEIDSLVQ